MFIFYFIIIIRNEFEFDDLKYCVLISVLRFTGSCYVTRHVSIDSFDSKWYWFDVFNLVHGIDLLIVRNIQYFFLFAVNLGRD